MFLYQVGQIGKTAASGLGLERPPFALEGLAGSGDGDIDIFLGSFMNGDDWFLVGRIDGFKGLAVDAFNPFVVDESEPRLSAIWGLGGGVMDDDEGPHSFWNGAFSRSWSRRTYRPVGCSYFPVDGVSRVWESDMMVSWCDSRRLVAQYPAICNGKEGW